MHAIPNPALQAGWSPNSSEVIHDGTFLSASLVDALPSWQPFPTLYLWLSNSSVPSISYRIVTSTANPYIPTMSPAPSLTVNGDYFNVYAINDPDVNEPAVVMGTAGLCEVARSQTDRSGQFAINTAADWDDVDVYFTHDCYYPRVRIGQPPATDDVLAYSAGLNPNLSPDPTVHLSVTANTGEELLLAMRVVDTGEEQWQRGQNATFTIDFTASNDVLLRTTIITPKLKTQQLLTICTTLNELPPANITVASVCTDAASSGYVTLQLNFNFQRLYTVPVNITCRPEKNVNPLQSFGVDLVPGAQFGDATVSRVSIAVNGTVAATSAFSVAASQPYTFATPQRYVSLSVYNNYSNRNLTGRLTVSADSWLVGLTANSAATSRGTDSFSFAIQSNKLNVLIETQCEYSQQLQTTTVLIDTLSDGVDFYYDPVEFTYQWTCRQPPQFALSTKQPSNGRQSSGNLINVGQPSDTAGGDWTVDANSSVAGVINVNYNIQAPLESLIGAVLYLTLQSRNATVFAWSLDTDSSNGLSATQFEMLGQPIRPGSTSYRTTLPLSSTDITTQLVLDALICSRPQYVQISTRLTYGWLQYVTINFIRRCDTADRYNYTNALGGGAVAAIVLLVLATACCFMCCGWRYSSKGKRGWEVLPFYDWWGRVQDRTLGPKRYTGPQMVETDIDGMGEEVEISSTGGYGSTSYQNDL